MQSGINFLEGEVRGGDAWRESQRVIADDDREQKGNKQNQNQNQNLDLVIKVSVPDWKVMAFSTEHDGQLVWEHQVRRLKHSMLISDFVAIKLTLIAVVYLNSGLLEVITL